MLARIALLALAIVCLSLPALLIRGANAPAEALGFWRLALACAALLPWAWRRRGVWSGLGSGDRGLTFLAGTLFFVHLWTFVLAVQRTSIAHTMLVFSTHPLWTGLGAWLFFAEPPTLRLLAAYALAGSGVYVLLGGAHAASAGLSGDLAALASALSFSAYVLASRGARRRLDNASFVFAAYSLTALLFLGAAALRGTPMTGYAPRAWAAFAGLAFGVTLGGHSLFTYLLESFDVNLLSCAKLFEPVLASLGARLLFGEALTPRAAGAFGLIAAGVLVLLLPLRGGRRSDPAELDDA